MNRSALLASAFALLSAGCGGGGGGGVSPIDENLPDQITTDPNPMNANDEKFGTSMSLADFDGDGVRDLAIGAPGANHVYVYKGKDDGTFALPRQLTTPPEAQAFGEALGAADFDGDGRPDLLVGAPDSPVGPLALAGKVYVFTGPLDPLATVPTELTETAPQGGAGFGRQIATPDPDDYSPGNHDRFALIGPPDATVGGNLSAGRITEVTHDHAANRNVRLSVEDYALPTPQARFGSVICVNDLEGDDVPDVIVGRMGLIKTPNTRTGHVTLIRRTAAAETGLVISAPVELGDDADFGWSVAAGDVDGDGRREILVGTPRAVGAIGVKRTGAVVIVTLNVGGTLSVSLESLLPHNEVDQNLDGDFGVCVCAGDGDGDGRDDVLAFAPGALSARKGNFVNRGVLYAITGLNDLDRALVGELAVGARANLTVVNQRRLGFTLGRATSVDGVWLGDADPSGNPEDSGTVSHYAWRTGHVTLLR